MERGHLSERDAAVNARAILEVIRHCHDRYVPLCARLQCRACLSFRPQVRSAGESILTGLTMCHI